MIREEFLQLLRCPLGHGPLTVADPELLAQLNRSIRAGGVRNRGGEIVDRVLDAGLLDADRTLIYPVYDGIVTLMMDGAIPLDDYSDGKGSDDSSPPSAGTFNG